MSGEMEKRYILDVGVADALCELIARIIVHRYSDDELNELCISDLEPVVERQLIKLADVIIKTKDYNPPTFPHQGCYKLQDITDRITAKIYDIM